VLATWTAELPVAAGLRWYGEIRGGYIVHYDTGQLLAPVERAGAPLPAEALRALIRGVGSLFLRYEAAACEVRRCRWPDRAVRSHGSYISFESVMLTRAKGSRVPRIGLR
jgi:hypothetical protein